MPAHPKLTPDNTATALPTARKAKKRSALIALRLSCQRLTGAGAPAAGAESMSNEVCFDPSSVTGSAFPASRVASNTTA